MEDTLCNFRNRRTFGAEMSVRVQDVHLFWSFRMRTFFAVRRMSLVAPFRSWREVSVYTRLFAFC